jgi:putative endonuclease
MSPDRSEGVFDARGAGGPLTLPSLVAIMLDMAYFVYILRCADNNLYYGYTGDLARRVQEHRQGEVPSTKPRLPVELVYYEVHAEASEARKRERGLKNGRTRAKTIEWMIKTFPREKLLPFA